jgi:hypothetical protein
MRMKTVFVLGLWVLLVWVPATQGVVADDAGGGPPSSSLSTTSSSSSNATLVFSTQCTLLSEPLSHSVQELRQFLQRDDIRNLFLSAGGARPCHTLSSSSLSSSSSHNNDDDDNTLRNLWKQACDRYYGPDAFPFDTSNHDNNNDNDDNTIVATETSAQFPGFRIITTVVNGCRRIVPTTTSTTTTATTTSPLPSFRPTTKTKTTTTTVGLRERIMSLRHATSTMTMNSRQGGKLTTTMTTTKEDENERVVYRFYLIADRKRWEGPKAVVWLVRKLTGGGNPPAESSKSFHPSETRATTHVSVVETPLSSTTITPFISSIPQEPIKDQSSPSLSSPSSPTSTTAKSITDTAMYGFQIEIDCSVQVEFPKILLRLLPSSRSKVEEQGTRAVHEALLKDASSALMAVQKAWWNQQQQQQQQQQQEQSPLDVVETETSLADTTRFRWRWGRPARGPTSTL